MKIAQQLSKKSRIEHLLYLWQVEDILRAYDLNFDRVKAEYLSRFKFQDESERAANDKWYEDRCQMMIGEGLRERGHLQIHEHLLQELEETHQRLLKDDKFPYYRQMYYKVLPYIVELRAKGGRSDNKEIGVCMDFLYGLLLLRLQHKEITPETERAATDITTLLGQLSDYYFKLEETAEV